ncbi:MAG: hypothetical protein AAB732_00375, partial [Patescibacteria group bacterium]
GGASTTFYVWATQLEKQSFPSLYVKTEGTSITTTQRGLVSQSTGYSLFLGSNVGIGTTIPAARLTVVDPSYTGVPSGATIGLFGSTDGSTTGISIRARGTITGGLADFGEYAEVVGNVEDYIIGDLLAISQEKEKFIKSNLPYQTTLAGIVTETAGLIAGGGDKTIEFDEKGKATNRIIIALAGRVPVKISLENGEIKQGDYLTSSNISGTAMKATEPGKVIGLALESISEADFENCEIEDSLKIENCEFKIGKIMVFLNPHWNFTIIEDEKENNQTENKDQTILDKFTLAIKNSLEKLGLIFENGIAKIKEIFAEKITANNLEMIDKATGEKYCTWIENGEWVKIKGECAKQETSTLTPIINSEPV